MGLLCQLVSQLDNAAPVRLASADQSAKVTILDENEVADECENVGHFAVMVLSRSRWY